MILIYIVAFIMLCLLAYALSSLDRNLKEKRLKAQKEVDDLTIKIKELKQSYQTQKEECVDILEKKTRLEKELDNLNERIYNAEQHYETIMDNSLQVLSFPKSITPPTVQAANAIVGMDFEYLITGRQDTPCQVGLVLIVEDVIMLRYSSLIHVPESIEGTLSYGNGITREMVKNAPSFADVIKVMESICKGATIVAHNKSTEVSVLKKACELHQVESWLTTATIKDTCKLMGGKGLQECCEQYNIPLHHHDALSDAEACARLYIISQGKEVVEEHVRIFGKRAKETCTGDVYKPISSDQVENKNTPFFGGVKTVVSGTFDNFPDRGKLKELLQSLGADVDTTVTKRTQIFVAGKDCGPKKMEKVEAYGIRIINEKELMTYIK